VTIGEAKSEVLCAMSGYETLGAVKDVEDCMELLQEIEIKQLAVSGDPLEMMVLPINIEPASSVHGAE